MFIKNLVLVGYGMLSRLSKLTVSFMLAFKSVRFVCLFFVHPMPRLMIKRAQGRNRLGRKNFKKRYFCLTNQYLAYAKSKGWAEEERQRKMWYFFPSPVLFLLQYSVFVWSDFVLIQFVKCSCPLFTWLCYALQSDVLIKVFFLCCLFVFHQKWVVCW